MTKTNTKYINEYSLFDDVFEFVEKCNNELDSIMYNYKMEQRQNELRSFFEAEAVDNETKNSGEKEGILTKIGNVVLTLLKKISDFITSITSKLFKNKKKIETDVDKVNRIIKNNPSLRDDIVKGINNEWYTYKDIAKLENNIVALCQEIENKKIENKKFKDKVKDVLTDFNKDSIPFIAASLTLVKYMNVLPKLEEGANKSKQSLCNLKSYLEGCKDRIKDSETLNTITSSIGEVFSVISKYTNNLINAQNQASSILGNVGNDTTKESADDDLTYNESIFE